MDKTIYVRPKVTRGLAETDGLNDSLCVS